MDHHKGRQEAGHLLVNAAIWLAVTVLVLAVAFPAAGKIREDRRVSKVLDVTYDLETACRKHYADTKSYALEFSPSKSGQYSSTRYHHLSMKQSAAGWRGPYLERPLSSDDNPFGGAVYLQNNLGAEPARGFRMKGTDLVLRDGPGQFVVFYGVPEEIAEVVDRRLDGYEESWAKTGRVEWQRNGGGALVIKLSLSDVKETK